MNIKFVAHAHFVSQAYPVAQAFLPVFFLAFTLHAAPTIRDIQPRGAQRGKTFTLYVRGDAESKIPVWRMIGASLDELDARAQAIASGCPRAELIDGRSMIGGGSLPEESLATRLVALGVEKRVGAARLAARLREGGIIVRIEDDRVLLDPRTIDRKDDGRVIEILANVS